MGALSKWVQGVSGDTPLHDAATTILQPRLDAVAALLERAADKPGSPDDVHMLRVASRRAAAALDVLAAGFPEKHVKRARRRLKRIRRAAGAARDIDVHGALLSRLRKKADDEQKPVIDFLLRSLDARRAPAAAQIRDVARRHPPADVRRCSKRLLKADTPDESRRLTMLDSARATLSRLAAEARRLGASDLSDPERLHELRIACKRLRYAMEVYACCFTPAFRDALYPRLEEVQEALGAVNDCQQMVTRLENALRMLDERASFDGLPPRAELHAGIVRLLARFRAQRDARAHGFAEWWSAFSHDGFFERLHELIGANLAPLETPAPSAAIHEPPIRRVPTPAILPVEQLHAAVHNGGPHENRSMRLAAIDVGTNSIRLLVAEAYADGSYRILDDEKEVTRLGRGLATTGSLEPIAMQQSALAVARMKSIAEGYGAATVRAVGTCAVREASNGDDFLDMVRQRAGVALEVLTAKDEARLSHLSAARAFDLRSLPSVVADIGGGSTELILSSGGVIERIFTLPLGAVRLTEQFGGPEEAAGARFDEMRDWIRETVRSVVENPPFLPQILIGAGGTFESLAKIAMNREQGAPSGHAAAATVRGYDMRRKDIKRLVRLLRDTPLRDRAKIPGLSPQRSEIIVAGAAIISAVMKRLDVDRLRVHDGGIRDGLLLTMIADVFQTGDADEPRGRMRSVRQFAASCNYERRHCYHVARLTLQIYDLLVARCAGQPEPWADPAARTLLEAAAILHDVGYHINYDKHHLHSYHLIIHSDLAGFSRREIEIIANIARYHRGSEPKNTHPPYAALSKADRELVRKLSALLRLADGLDRTHMQNIRSVELRFGADDVTLALEADRDPAVDVWGSERKSGLFSAEFGLAPRYEWPAGTPVNARSEGDETPADVPARQRPAPTHFG